MTPEIDVNREYYGKPKAGRDDYWRKMAAPRFRMKILLNLVGKSPGSRVMDLGCGGGNLLEEVRRNFPTMHLHGVDQSTAEMKRNAIRFPDISWTTADLNEPGLDLLAGTQPFDWVIASEIIEHIEHPSILLQNALGAVRPGGRMVLSTQSGKVFDTEKRVGHRRHFSSQELREMLAATGWRPLRVWNEGFPFHDGSKRLANLFPSLSMSHFGDRPYGKWQDAVCLALRVLFKLNSSVRGAQLFAVAEKP